MSVSKPNSLIIKEATEGTRLNFLTSSKSLSPDTIRVLFDKVRSGERNVSRSFISRTLNVNDVVAECCLRHLEENLRSNQNYLDRVLQQANSLPSSSPNDQARFLNDTFGVQGRVSAAILNHLRAAGA